VGKQSDEAAWNYVNNKATANSAAVFITMRPCSALCAMPVAYNIKYQNWKIRKKYQV
jgi:hypothetical protein